MSDEFATSRDGTRIAYDVVGNGPAFILLHGGGHNRRDWHDAGWVTRLRNSFRVIAIDARGSGSSDIPPDPRLYTPERQTDDVLAVADARGVDEFSLWGYSYGGNIGRYLAARSPRVRRFVMIGIPFGPAAFGGFRRMIEALQPSPAVAWLIGLLDWPPIEPKDLRCPTLWLIGSANEAAMASAAERRAALPETSVRLQILDGLDHEREFSDVARVLPPALQCSLP